MIEDYLKMKNPDFNINNTLPVARPGLPFIALSVAIVIVFALLDWEWLRNISAILALGVIWFFRDPERVTPPGDYGLSPADGQIIKIEHVEDNPFTENKAIKVSIFMNIFSVHVNRAPVEGRIIKQIYFPGLFFNASFDKASDLNEKNAVVVEDTKGRQVAFVQIAGLVARRIISWVQEGDELKRGQRFGMIRFGSRVDLYLPPDAEVMVSVGQKVNAGWSPIWR